MNKDLIERIQNRLEQLEDGVVDDLGDKRDGYLIEEVGAHGEVKRATIVNREKYLEFCMECLTDKIVQLGSDIGEETGIWGDKG
jgi:hypothetical protein